MKKILKTLLTTTIIFLTNNSIVSAQNGLTNPAVSGNLGSKPAAAETGDTFLAYFITLWKALITVGALIVIVMFLWGAIEWISAGGDAGKVSKARDKITQSVIGLIILVGSFVIIGFVGQLFFGDSFDILNLTLPTQN